MKKVFAFVLIILSCNTFACKCIPISPITKDLCKDYDVIFYGAVDSVSHCNTKGMATSYFAISELYKGNSEKTVHVNFDCSSSCMMSFTKGEEWIIYAKYEKFDELKVMFCEHSRKKFDDVSQDLYFLATQKTFVEEKDFLKTTLGLQKFLQANELNIQQQELGPQNKQPSSWGKFALLLISLVVMGLIYYFTRKK